MRAQPVTPMRAGFPDPAEIEGRVRASTIDKDPENSSSGIQGDESFITLIKDAGVATTNGTFATVENQLGEIIANFVSNKVKQLCSNAYRNMPAVENNEISIPEIVPEDSTSFAAVVMVDVSGYSNLTASLAERGPVGAAILSKIMKGYLDSIIELIIKNGGDIVKFVGDAVIVCWRSTGTGAIDLSDNFFDIERGELVYKAAYCCLKLLTELGEYPINIEDCSTKKLRIHLGIGAGLISDIVVGGHPGRWEHFLAGDAVNQLSQVLDSAKAGELALSHQALKWLVWVVDVRTLNLGDYDKRYIKLNGLAQARRKVPEPKTIVSKSFQYESQKEKEMVTGLYKLFMDRTAVFKLQCDINQANLFQLQSGLEDLLELAELRQITTVFIKIKDLQQAEAEASYTLLQKAQDAISVVLAALKRWDGCLRQFHVDDKGAVILCFFGLPPLAHENDSKLGLNAGVEIRDKFEDLFEDFSMGITTGVVSFGGVGAYGRAEYAVMGDAINMAARLMCHKEAKNAILCDQKTYNLCQGEFQFDNIGEIMVKGKAHPISVFRPVFSIAGGESSTTNLRAGNAKNLFLGRERERHLFNVVLSQMKISPTVNNFLVSAEGGLGLTTFANHCRTKAVKTGCYLCTAKATQNEENTSFYVFRNIISDLILLLEITTVTKEGEFILPGEGANFNKTSLSGQLVSLQEETSETQDNSSSEERKAAIGGLTVTIKSDSIHEDYLHAKSSENGVSTTETIFPKVKQFNSIIKPVKESVTMSPVSESAFSMEESMYRHDQEPEHIENEDSEPLSTGHLTSDEIPENGATDEPQIEHLGVDQFNENLKLSVTQGKLSVNTQSSAMENKESNPKPLAISPKRRPSKRSVLNSKGNSSSEPPSAQTNFSSPQYVGSSAARTDFFSPQSSSGDIDIQQRICNAVKKFNCTDSQVTLLKLVAQTPDDESEAVIQAHLKLHSKDLLDILSKIFNTLTERNKVGIHITEAHYIDRQSWDLLMDLAVACPRLPLMMYNRPINTFESKENKRIYRLITQLPRSQEVSLQGLSLDETTSLIKATWQPHVLRSVDPIISESIYKRTDGNPFFITSLVLALKDSGQWRISPVGDLTTPDAKFDFDRLVLGYDNQNIVLAQFDKLDRNFQLFLKIASVLGHKFSLDNVIYFITGLPDLNQHVNKHQYQTIVKSIATTDKYKFLVMEKPVVDEGSYFQFRSTLVQSCIYNMMVQNQRQQLHLLAARFLENRINDQNKHRFVVSILDHYMNTAESHQAKRIQYSETAAFFFFEKEDFSEAIKYYKQVLQLVQKPEGGYIDSISKHKIANFRRELGYSLMMMNEIDEAETNLRLSLELMDIKWPLPGLRFAFATQTQSKKRAEQDKRFFRDRPPLMIEDYTQSYVSRVGGISGYSLTNLPQTAKDKSKGEYSGEDMSMSLSALRVGASLSPAQEVIRITRDMILAGQQHALVSLAEVLLKKGDFKGHFYAILLGLNIGFEKGIENHMSKLYALGALAHRHQMKDNSELPIQYMEAAISFDLRTDIHISLNQVSSHAILLFLLGQFEACLTKVEIMYYLSGMAGDLNFRVVAQHFKCLALSHSKPQEMSLKTARALLSFSNQREIDYGSFWGSFHIIQNLLGQDSSKEEILSLIDNIEKHSETLPKALIHVFVAKECIKITVGICCDWVVDFHKSLDTLSHLVETVPFNEWMVYDGFSILIIGIFNGLRFKKFDDHSVALCTQLCRNINVCLKEMKGLGGLRETMRRIFKGLRVYPKNPDSAIKIWKAGIDDDSEDIYVQGMLCAMIGITGNDAVCTEKAEDNFVTLKARRRFEVLFPSPAEN